MKKLICLCMAISILFLLPSCSKKTEEKKETTSDTVRISTSDEGYPVPNKQNWEESNNATGARFNFTLKEFTDNFNAMYNSLGGSLEEIDYALWQVKSENQVDENGVVYDNYYYAFDGVVLTATIEKQSNKIMNLGCGTTVSIFVDNSKSQQQTVILGMAGVMACVAGDYPVDNVTFFGNLFVNDISNTNNSFWFNNCIYLVNIEEGKTDEDSTVLFRIVPAADNIEKEWNILNYKTYLEDKKQEETTESVPVSTSPQIVGAEEKKVTDSTENAE